MAGPAQFVCGLADGGLFRPDGVVLRAGLGAAGESVRILLSLFRKLENRIPGSTGHLVLLDHRLGDPAADAGIYAAGVRVADSRARPHARPALVLPVAGLVCRVGKLAW